MSRKISIDTFPQDNIVRFLYKYGGIKKNHSGNTTSPYIQVLLAEIDENSKTIIHNYTSTYVKLNELHNASLGSLWKGQILLSKSFKFNNRIKKKDFIIRLDYHPPKNVKYDFVLEHFKKLNCHIEILEYLNIPNLNFDKNNEKIVKQFNKVNYALLKSTKNVNIFISSIDVINTLYCRDMLIKEKLLSTPIIEIINEYLEDFEVLEKKHRCYRVKIRNSKKKAENTIKFLAFLALNKSVQEKIIRLQASLEDIDYNENQQDTIRFPIALPPQTCELKIKTEGFWWGNSFFVIKINGIISSTYDYITIHQFSKEFNSYERFI